MRGHRRFYLPWLVALGLTSAGLVEVARGRLGIDYYPPFPDRGVITNLPGVEVWWFCPCEENGLRQLAFLEVNPPEGSLVQTRTSELLCGSKERW